MQKDGSDETVLHTGIDGKKHAYCPYSETAQNYDQTRAPLGVNVFLGALAQNGSQLETQNVLDSGCGTGTFMNAIRGQVGSVTGMDYNEGMLQQAKANLGHKVFLHGSDLLHGSADNLPFEFGKYDTCSMNQVVHHFPKDDEYRFLKKSFEEAFRVLKPGGVLNQEPF